MPNLVNEKQVNIRIQILRLKAEKVITIKFFNPIKLHNGLIKNTGNP